jgi:hypothetical protein
MKFILCKWQRKYVLDAMYRLKALLDKALIFLVGINPDLRKS